MRTVGTISAGRREAAGDATSAFAGAGDTDGAGRRAACAAADEPDLFFPDRSDPATEALLVCGGCPVVRECAAYALSTRERHGVWGGMTERDRELWWARQSRRATVAKRRGA